MEGTGLCGVSTGKDYIYNETYNQIATVGAGNGLSAGPMGFLNNPWDTKLILPLPPRGGSQSIGNPANQT